MKLNEHFADYETRGLALENILHSFKTKVQNLKKTFITIRTKS